MTLDQEKKNRRWLKLVALLFPLVRMIAFLFPKMLPRIINKQLSKISNVTAELSAIELTASSVHLKLDHLALEHIELSSGQYSIFSSFKSLDIDLDKAALWDGVIKLGIAIASPSVTFYKGSKEGSPAPKKAQSMKDPGLKIILTKLELTGGRFEFTDHTTDPNIHIGVSAIQGKVSNICVGCSSQEQSAIFLKGWIAGGTFEVDMKARLFSPTPDFDLKAAIETVDMVQLNTIFQAYGKFDVNKGTMQMHTEVSASQGHYKGYVQSSIKDMDVLGPEDRKDGILRYLWEALIGAAAYLLADRSNDKIDAKIEFDQSLSKPDVHIGRAVLEILTNAFLHGLNPYMKNMIKIKL